MGFFGGWSQKGTGAARKNDRGQALVVREHKTYFLLQG